MPDRPNILLIRNPITGEEQLFHLESYPNDCIGLSNDSAHGETFELWRIRMVKELEGR